MPQRSYLWTVRLLGVAIYSLVFICSYNYWQTINVFRHGQPELLLFVLPGALMAWLQADSPLKNTLLMVLWGTLLAGILLNSTLICSGHYVTLFAWSLSAAFWAGCGALLMRLLRIMSALRN